MRESAADRWPARCAKFPESFSQPADINIVCHNYSVRYARKTDSSVTSEGSTRLCGRIQDSPVGTVSRLRFSVLRSVHTSAGIHPERAWDTFPRNTVAGAWNLPHIAVLAEAQNDWDSKCYLISVAAYVLLRYRDVIGFSDPVKVMR